MLVVERLVVGDPGQPRVDVRAAEVLGRHVLARGRLHERRAAEEDRARSLDDHRLVAHGRHVGPAGGAAAHDERDLRDPERGHPRLVVEDPPEVIAVGKDVRLQRQERAARVHQVHARQPVLERDLLRPQVLLDGDGVVGAALDRGVVRHDDAGRALDPADAGDHPGPGASSSYRPFAASGLSSRNAVQDRAGDRSARGPAACRVPGGGQWTVRHRRRRRRPGLPGAPKLCDEVGHGSVVGASPSLDGSSRLRRTGM